MEGANGPLHKGGGCSTLQVRGVGGRGCSTLQVRGSRGGGRCRRRWCTGDIEGEKTSQNVDTRGTAVATFVQR